MNKNNLLNWSILINRGKENDDDFQSNGEWNGIWAQENKPFLRKGDVFEEMWLTMECFDWFNFDGIFEQRRWNSCLIDWNVFFELLVAFKESYYLRV